MANTCVTTYQLNGSRIFAAKIVIEADTNAEIAATDTIIPADLTGLVAGDKFKITEIQWSLPGFTVNLLWDATADVLAASLDGNGGIRFSDTGAPLLNDAGDGVTGKLQLSTVGLLAGAKGVIFIKGIH